MHTKGRFDMKVGDRVDVHFTCGESLRNVEVVYMPCGMGDSWELKSTDGRLYRVLLFEMMSQLSESVEGVREQSGEAPSQQLKQAIALLDRCSGMVIDGCLKMEINQFIKQATARV